MESTTTLQPEIKTSFHSLNLPDPTLPSFNVSLIQLPKESIMIFIGTGLPISIGNDFSVAMLNPKNPKLSTSTSISKTSASSLSLSSKLTKRYKQQVFLSMDLNALINTGGTADYVLLGLEKALLECLDPILKK